VEITKDTRVSDILREYGDIAEVMEVFGIERAAKVHRVPVDEFPATLRAAVGQTPPA
jgi:hypothetical protein